MWRSWANHCMRAKKFLMVVLLCVVVPAYARAPIQFAGSVQATKVGAGTVDFFLQEGAVARVQVLDAKVVRIRLNPTGTFTSRVSGAISISLDPASPSSTIVDLPEATYLVTASIRVVVYKNPFHVTISRSDGSVVTADLTNAIAWDSGTGLIINRKFAPQDEYYFGLGLLGGPINRRGRSLFMMNQDAGAYEEFSSPLYSTTPFFYGIRNGSAYGLFLDNPAVPVFDMDSFQNGVLTFGALQGALDYYVMTGPAMQDVANLFAKLTGFTPLPPKWTLGYHQSRFGYASHFGIRVFHAMHCTSISLIWITFKRSPGIL